MNNDNNDNEDDNDDDSFGDEYVFYCWVRGVGKRGKQKKIGNEMNLNFCRCNFMCSRKLTRTIDFDKD